MAEKGIRALTNNERKRRYKIRKNNRCPGCDKLISPDAKRCSRCATKYLWSKSNYRTEMVKKHNGKKHSKITKEKMSKSAIESWTAERKTKQAERIKGMGHPFYEKHHTEEVKKLLSIKRSGEKNPRYGLYGSANPCWKGGNTRNGYAYNWLRITERIRKRDNYKCQNCNSHSYLEVHHLDLNRKNNKSSNLITLCRYCHKKLHKDLRLVSNG